MSSVCFAKRLFKYYFVIKRGYIGTSRNCGRNVGNILEPIETEKLLGGFISSNLKWTENIRDNKKSINRMVSSRLNALVKVCQVSNFKTRLMIANGIIMSKLIQLIQLWGGTHSFLLSFLQGEKIRFIRELLVC